jgi:glycerate 2-kinase
MLHAPRSMLFKNFSHFFMKVLIAPDKFKGTLTAEEVAEAIAEGIRSVNPEIKAIQFPLADGGDGTAALLTKHFKGEFIRIEVHNPLFEIIEASYGYSASSRTAFIEMSAASGLRLIPVEKRNPLNTSTLGTGEMIIDAIHHGAEKIILGIGGSATNDAGIGMAAAMGFRFIDRNGNELKPVGANLESIQTIDDSTRSFNPAGINVQVACDVDNPLYGKKGAAYLYGPQKGATPETVIKLDKGLRNFAKVVREKYGKDIHRIPGSGAAGGLGAGAVVFLNARLRSGIEMVMDITGFEDHLKTTDLIVTGEGKLDDQSFQGKVIDGITKLAKKYNVPVIAVCGDLKLDKKKLNDHGIREALSLVDYFGSVSQAMDNPETGITEVTKILLKKYTTR